MRLFCPFLIMVRCHRLPKAAAFPAEMASFAQRRAASISRRGFTSGGAFPHQPQQLPPAIKSRRLSLACASLSNVAKPDARSLGCFFDLNSAIPDPALLLVYLAPRSPHRAINPMARGFERRDPSGSIP